MKPGDFVKVVGANTGRWHGAVGLVLSVDGNDVIDVEFGDLPSTTFFAYELRPSVAAQQEAS